MTTINVKKINDKAILPTYGSEYAAGADLYACLDEPLTIKRHCTHRSCNGNPRRLCRSYISAKRSCFKKRSCPC